MMTLEHQAPDHRASHPNRGVAHCLVHARRQVNRITPRFSSTKPLRLEECSVLFAVSTAMRD